MRCKLLGILAGALSLGVVQIASAADMPVKAAKPFVVAPYNWTGLYIGVHAGYGWDAKDVDFGPSTAATTVFFTANEFPTSLSPNAKGFLGGMQIGYNWQLANFVVGVEADLSGSGIKGNASLTPTPTAGAVFTTSAEKKVPWFGTLRARLGLPVNNWLFYATGGLAYGKTELSFNTAPIAFACGPGFTCASGTSSSTKVGWTVGAGVEYALRTNWTVRAEYLYVDLGSQSLTVVSTAPGFGFTASSRFDEHIVRAGVNYKF